MEPADDPRRPLREVVHDLIAPELDVANVDVSGKRVLLRVDFNVPVDEATGVVTGELLVALTCHACACT